tara:strand:+ start:379 stop:942 length:564 start_codon:yes stop_codon:yes gene_type:complete
MKTEKFSLITRDFLIKNFNSDFILKDSDKDFKEKINERRYSLNKSRHSPKNIIMWEDHGLIKDNRKDNETWKKYSFTESVWIDLIKKLKNYGLYRDTILPIKQMLCEVEDKAKICEFTLLDFYIKQILVEKQQVFIITDNRGKAFIITKDLLATVEELPDYDYEDMLRVNLTSLVKQLAEELIIEVE